MISLVMSFFKRNKDEGELRSLYGVVCGGVGIFLNICLFIMKLLVGIIFNSVAIESDAFNNLSDAISSIVTILSFKLSMRPADKEHPFGHARYEWLASLFLAVMIFFVAFELIKSSILKIFKPQALQFTTLTLIVLIISILIKLYMYFYNRHYAKLVDSSVLEATALDSISDVISTSAILVSFIISKFINYNLDGIAGLIVACMIAKGAWQILKEALDSILGKAPSEDFVSEVKSIVLSHPGILGIHDLMIHDYGYGKGIASLHVEVDASVDIMKSHALVDHIERELKAKCNLLVSIHMDPILVGDELCNEWKKYLIDVLLLLDEHLTLHDFQMMEQEGKQFVAFDVVLYHGIKLTQEEITTYLETKIKEKDEQYELLITFDYNYD